MKYQFGEKLRSVRERRSLTLKEVAEKAGVSESLVSQIERNRVSPAVDTLLTLADVLEIDYEYLFADFRKDRDLRIVKKKDREILITAPGVHYERLVQVEEQGRDCIEAYAITLAVGAKTGNTEYGHPGWELGIVESGQADLTVGNRTYTLKAGDSASFRADSPHILANSGGKPLKVFWVITPPKTTAK